VVTTFLPITQFTKAVAGDRAEVTQLLPTNVGPHDYQAKPEDAQRLAEADVLVQNGLEMEEFLEDLVENAGNPDLTIMILANELPLSPTKTLKVTSRQKVRSMNMQKAKNTRKKDITITANLILTSGLIQNVRLSK
jgi:ABC-type Zn uptake system ZnuABC Zn-binding protein ZnuA